MIAQAGYSLLLETVTDAGERTLEHEKRRSISRDKDKVAGVLSSSKDEGADSMPFVRTW